MGISNKYIIVPLDLVKSLISWIAGKFGFTEFEKLLDSVSFTELFGKAVDWLFVDVPAWFAENLSFAKAKEVLGKGMDIIGEFGKTISRLISRAWGFIKNLFGFGDKSDFGQEEMPVTKDVRAFLTFEWVNDLLKPVTDFFKSIMDFDFMGFIKKIPGVGALLDYISGDDKPKDKISLESGSGVDTNIVIVNRVLKDATNERVDKLIDEIKFIEELLTLINP